MIRELEVTDIDEYYMKLLCQLSGKEKEYIWQDMWPFWLRYENNDHHQTFVYEDKGRVIGTASALIEHKFLHYGSSVGHIEDVVVDKHSRLSGVGKGLIEECVEFCKKGKCYKVILDCSKENIPFYESCGFQYSENCMRKDLIDG
jgi:glucosamine-phosphate N-acetyltransferase